MIKLPRENRSRQLALLRSIAYYLHTHRADEELRVRQCFAVERDNWRRKHDRDRAAL